MQEEGPLNDPKYQKILTEFDSLPKYELRNFIAYELAIRHPKYIKESSYIPKLLEYVKEHFPKELPEKDYKIELTDKHYNDDKINYLESIVTLYVMDLYPKLEKDCKQNESIIYNILRQCDNELIDNCFKYKDTNYFIQTYGVYPLYYPNIEYPNYEKTPTSEPCFDKLQNVLNFNSSVKANHDILPIFSRPIVRIPSEFAVSDYSETNESSLILNKQPKNIAIPINFGQSYEEVQSYVKAIYDKIKENHMKYQPISDKDERNEQQSISEPLLVKTAYEEFISSLDQLDIHNKLSTSKKFIAILYIADAMQEGKHDSDIIADVNQIVRPVGKLHFSPTSYREYVKIKKEYIDQQKYFDLLVGYEEHIDKN